MNLSFAQLLIAQKKDLTRFFLENGPEFPFMEGLTAYLDEYFSSVFQASNTAPQMMQEDPFAIIALGGYGRKEQCVHSDIDLLLLFEEKISPHAETFIREILYPLWDAKFEVGYAVRTSKEAMDIAFSRFDVLTTVLDSRFVCGDESIHTKFMGEFTRRLTAGHMEENLNNFLKFGQKRLKDFGDSTYLVSPNLKSGLGGLRDYHSMLWYGKIIHPIKSPKDLLTYGLLSHFEYEMLMEGLDYIWYTRNHLHLLTGRKCDILYFEYQTRVAQNMGYKSGSRKTDVERFLGDLHARMEFLKQVSQITTEYILANIQVSRPNKSAMKQTRTRGLVVVRNRLHFDNTLVVVQQPDLLLRIFLESGRTRIPLSIKAQRLISEFLHVVDDDLRARQDCLDTFKKILSLSFWEFNVLNLMLTTGILEAFIPEFAAIKDKIQYNQYHLFPVDKHSIRCVQVVNSFRNTGTSPMEKLYAKIFRDVRNKNLLLLSALLHDIGKSDPACEHSRKGAQMAEPIFRRFGFSESDIKDGCLLITHHLLIVKTATRRDVFDEETAMFLAGKVGSIRVLRMLYLLTVADSQATGPKAWNRWTESLIKDLFFNTLALMREKKLLFKRNQKLIEKKKEQVIDALKEEIPEDTITNRLDAMPHRYFMEVSTDKIMAHIMLIQTLKEHRFVFQVVPHEATDTRSVSIYGKDSPGFYSKIAGVFFLHSIDIIASQAYSMDSGFLLDVFTVTPPQDRLFEQEKWDAIQKDLLLALEDDHFLDQVLDKIPKKLVLSAGVFKEPSRVRIDNKTSSFFTIIEVFTYNFFGLLFLLTNALYRSGLDVHTAMVGGKVDQVIDIFYVRNLSDNRKIQDEKVLAQIQNHIMDSLPEIKAKE